MSRWLERFRPYLMVAPAIIVFVLFFLSIRLAI